ncbi:hypothetical protein SK128_027885 [Halocaridina rubra]|uniref:Secreted protein n=1 Tax=Halocaridina rubra TaxID=373956 RepID=A0AAN8WMK6_HALRR
MFWLVVFTLPCVSKGALHQFGNLYIVTPQRFETDPHVSYRHRETFALKHGERGARLIESFGNGQFNQGNDNNHIYRRSSQTTLAWPFSLFGRR